jgi:hypothetical protein
LKLANTAWSCLLVAFKVGAVDERVAVVVHLVVTVFRYTRIHVGVCVVAVASARGKAVAVCVKPLVYDAVAVVVYAVTDFGGSGIHSRVAVVAVITA